MDETKTWLRQHGLDEAGATPVLAARLAARRSARLGNSLLLAGLFIAAALVQVFQMGNPGKPLLVALLTAVAGGLIATQFLLDRWVRGVDRRMGATLARRAAHPVQPGWRAVLGRPHAALVLIAFVGAVALAVSAVVVSETRWPALVLLTGVCGVAAVAAVQMRHLLTRPVVADDATSLTADVVMRIEDARDTSAPSVLFALPVVLLFGQAPAWWGAVAMVFLVVGTISLVVVQVKTPRSGAMARQVVGIS
jgi:hypothetical protein